MSEEKKDSVTAASLPIENYYTIIWFSEFRMVNFGG